MVILYLALGSNTSKLPSSSVSISWDSNSPTAPSASSMRSLAFLIAIPLLLETFPQNLNFLSSGTISSMGAVTDIIFVALLTRIPSESVNVTV